MIKIIESKLLLEQKWDDLLNQEEYYDGRGQSIIEWLRWSYNLDIENSTFTKTDPNQLKEGQPILFIFCWVSDLRTKKLHYEGYTHNIPGIPKDNKTLPYKFDILRTRDNRDIFTYFRDKDSEKYRPVDDNHALLPEYYVDFSFEELTKYCYAAYVVDAKFRDERDTQMLIKSAKSSKENTELLTKFIDFYKLANDIVKSMPDDNDSPTTVFPPRNLRRSWMLIVGDLRDILNQYNNATKWNRPTTLLDALNAMKDRLNDMNYYRTKYYMDKLIDKYVK